ncbi:MAG: N-acetyltransferase [Pseudomonadota bacterium]
MQTTNQIISEETAVPELRDAVFEDIADILHAQLTAFPDDPANLDEENFKEAILDGAHRLLVASIGSVFAGYVIVSNRAYRPWSSLDNLIVLPDFAGKGVGRCLLNGVMKPFRHRRILRLYVESKNHRAVGMYKRNGFTHLHTQKNNYENNDDALVMYKFL